MISPTKSTSAAELAMKIGTSVRLQTPKLPKSKMHGRGGVLSMPVVNCTLTGSMIRVPPLYRVAAATRSASSPRKRNSSPRAWSTSAAPRRRIR